MRDRFPEGSLRSVDRIGEARGTNVFTGSSLSNDILISQIADKTQGVLGNEFEGGLGGLTG